MKYFNLHKWTEDRSLSESEIPKDPNLPQLAELLDTKIMTLALQDLLPGKFATGSLKIERCRLGFIRYKPLHYCRLFYYLDIRDSENDIRRVQMIGGKVFFKRPSDNYIAKRTSGMQTIPDLGCSFVNSTRYKMLMTAFPNDFGIWKLNQLICPDELEEIVRRTMGLSVIRGGDPEDHSDAFKIMSYKPERSCLIRFSVRDANLFLKEDKGRPICGRTYHRGSKDLGANVYQVMNDIWNGDAKRSGLLSIPEPLGYDPDAKILFTETVSGIPMPTFVDCEAFLNHVRAAARSLVGIHQTPVSFERIQDIDALLNDLTFMSEDLGQIFPTMRKKFTIVLDLLRKTFPDQKNKMSLIHGDFSMNQILVDGDNVHVIDLESVCMGDPHSDIGTFIVRLDHLPASLRQRAAKEFSNEYESICPNVLNHDHLRWYQAIGFVKSARSSLKQLKQGWPCRVEYYLEEAKVLLSK